MRITALQTTKVRLPIAEPIRTAIHQIESVGAVVVRLEARARPRRRGGRQGRRMVGEGYAFTLNAVRLDAIDAMVRSLEHHFVGRDPHDAEAIWAQAWSELNFVGHQGISVFALTALDVALWDIVGKVSGQPLHKLWGGCRDAIKAYASGGLWLASDADALVGEARKFLDLGFRAMKVRVGRRSIEEDVRRVAAVRAAIGSDVELMADANQGLSVGHALRLGRRLDEFGLTWFEEPVAYSDLAGHARIAAALDTPLASGETEYTSQGMRRMIEAKAADLLMPDLQRMAGYTEFRRAAALCNAYHLPISPHIFTEHSLCLCGSLPNATHVEHMPWFEPLFRERMVLEDGMIRMPETPGTGFTVNPQVLRRHRLRK